MAGFAVLVDDEVTARNGMRPCLTSGRHILTQRAQTESGCRRGQPRETPLLKRLAPPDGACVRRCKVGCDAARADIQAAGVEISQPVLALVGVFALEEQVIPGQISAGTSARSHSSSKCKSRGAHMRRVALRGTTEGEGELTQCSTPFTFFGPSSTFEARISTILQQKSVKISVGCERCSGASSPCHWHLSSRQCT